MIRSQLQGRRHSSPQCLFIVTEKIEGASVSKSRAFSRSDETHNSLIKFQPKDIYLWDIASYSGMRRVPVNPYTVAASSSLA
jgi:hypothetical protein